LNPRDPVLPRVFAAIQPLVLPKLREENERLWSRKKGKSVKDVIAEGRQTRVAGILGPRLTSCSLVLPDEFEVAIFLRESRTRHALLTRNKTFHEPDSKKNKKLKPEPGEDLTEETGGPAKSARAEVILDSDDSEAEVDLRNIPEAAEDDNGPEVITLSEIGVDHQTGQEPAGDEKKLRFSTHYESFNITGWVLCLLITRKGDRAQGRTATSEPKQPLMEEWISSQAQTGLGED
jgi:hypothetical protein